MEYVVLILLLVIIILSLITRLAMERATNVIKDKDNKINEISKSGKLKDTLIDNKDKEIEKNKYSKKVYTDEEKKQYLLRKKEAIKKGKLYEEQVAQHYISAGYLVDERGKRKGKKDNGIDLLVKKDDIYTLIQCKNYAPTSIIQQKILRAFYGDCVAFIEKNNLPKNTNFKLIISNKESLSNNTIKYIEEYGNFECKIIKYIES